MTHAYAVANRLEGLAAGAVTWAHGYVPSTIERASVVDGRLGQRLTSGPAVAAPLRLRFDLGVARDIAGIFILNHSLCLGGWVAPTVEVVGADDAAFTVGVSVRKSVTPVSLLTHGAATRETALTFPFVTKRYWEVRFAEVTGTPTRQVAIGEVVFVEPSQLFTLSRRAIYGEGEGVEYVTSEVRLGGGDVSRVLRSGPIPTRQFSFADLTDTQRDELLAMWHRTRGGTLSMVWVPDFVSNTIASPADMFCIYGRLETMRGWTQADFQLFDVTGFTLRGRGREVGA